jgi:hypothetical protein
MALLPPLVNRCKAINSVIPTGSCVVVRSGRQAVATTNRMTSNVSYLGRPRAADLIWVLGGQPGTWPYWHALCTTFPSRIPFELGQTSCRTGFPITYIRNSEHLVATQ